MLKKALIGTGVTAAIAAFVFGTNVLSYAKTGARSIRESVKSEVPIQFEIKRAHKVVQDLVPNIRQCMHVIAEQQVDIEHMTAKMDRREEEMNKQEQQILALRGDLDTRTSFVYADETYSKAEVQQDLATRFDRFKAAKESLRRDKQILAARQKGLRANQRKLDDMIAARKDLEVELEQLEARMKTIEATEVASELEFDDSQLSQAKKLIRSLNKQLDVKVKLLDAEGHFPGLIPVEVEKEVPQDLERQIDDYFGKDADSTGIDVEI
jgi:peptidoglycan hydrolase CwlO-like protein